MARINVHRAVAFAGGVGLLTLGAIVGIAAPAQAATLDVGPTATYTTISAAVAAAVPGDTITVEAGTYAENVTLNKALTITSATPGAAIIQGGVTISAVATVNGFTIDPLSTTISALQIGAGGQGSSILNNTIDGSAQAVASSTLIRVGSAIGTAGAPTIVQGNTLENFGTAGQPSAIFISASSFVNVIDNTISNTGAIPAGSVAVNIANGANNVLVQGNTISGVENAVAAIAATAPPITAVTISGNTISNTSLSAVVLSNANMQNVAVTDNSFSDIAVGVAGRAAVQVGVPALPAPVGSAPLDGFAVSGNTIANTPNGVLLNAGVQLLNAQSFAVNTNTFSGITADAIAVDPTVNAPVAATGNDFGGAPVSGNVVVTAATPTPPSGGSGPGLAFTGTNVVPPLSISALLLLLGGVCFVLSRRSGRASRAMSGEARS